MFPKREEDQPTTLKRTLLTLWMNLDFESLAALNIPSLARLVGSRYYAGVEGSASNPGLGGIGAFMFVLPCGKGTQTELAAWQSGLFWRCLYARGIPSQPVSVLFLLFKIYQAIPSV